MEWYPVDHDARLGPRWRTVYKRLVAILAIWHWASVRLLRTPALALAGLSLLAWIPLLQSLWPFSGSLGALELVMLWTYPASMIGVAVGLATLTSASAFLARLDPLSRTAAELGALTLSGLYLLPPILVGALVSEPQLDDLGATLLDILVADLHLGGLALPILLLPVSTPLRVSFFLGSVWLLPALAVREPGLARLANLLDARACSRAEGAVRFLAPLAVVVASVAMTQLLRSPFARKPSG